jgi:U4/U6.U5 tri-snRNP-associated protein 2
MIGQHFCRFLNTLHRDLGGSKKKGSSIIYKTFQGEMKIMVETEKERKSDSDSKDEAVETVTKSSSTQFLYVFLNATLTCS